MRELASADLVLAEAMRGALLADILRVPWVLFSFGGQFNTDKWYDWAEAFSMSLQVAEIPGFMRQPGSLTAREGSIMAGNRLRSGCIAVALVGVNGEL
jgi:hypothetical protein